MCVFARVKETTVALRAVYGYQRRVELQLYQLWTVLSIDIRGLVVQTFINTLDSFYT